MHTPLQLSGQDRSSQRLPNQMLPPPQSAGHVQDEQSRAPLACIGWPSSQVAFLLQHWPTSATVGDSVGEGVVGVTVGAYVVGIGVGATDGYGAHVL